MSSKDPNSQFIVTKSHEIIRKIHIIEKHKCLITVRFGGARKSFITSIVKIDNKNKTFTIDESALPALNKELISSKHAYFETVMSGVRVRFTTHKISKIRFSDEILIDMPEEIFWLERRQFYRIKTPIMQPPQCIITIHTTKDGVTYSKEYSYDIYDLSLTGLCLLYEVEKDEKEEVINKKRLDILVTNETLKECFISFSETGEEFTCELQIRAKFPQNPAKPDNNQLIGTLFIGNKPGAESIIQRYMQHIERENKKKALE